VSSVGTYPHGRVPADVRQKQLLDVAEGLFAEGGYSATSIDGIATAAGVTRPVIYQHFGSKEGVYLAVLRRARGQMEELILENMADATDVQSRVRAAADAYFRFVELDPDRFRVLFGAGAGAVPPVVAEEAKQLHLATERRWAAMFSRDAPGYDERYYQVVAHAIGGAGNQLAQWWLRTPGISREQLVDWYCDITWGGISAMLAAAQADFPPSAK
jgi:AcrR family transcriptional regulator